MKRLSLTGFQLKYIALITMVFDHIHYFFDYTGKIPIWFTMIGRLAAPLFLFSVIEGFVHTHNRKKYFLKIYALAILMGLIQFGFYNFFTSSCETRWFLSTKYDVVVVRYFARCSSGYRLDSRKEISKRHPNLTFPLIASMVNGTFLSAKLKQTYVRFSTKFTQFYSATSSYNY